MGNQNTSGIVEDEKAKVEESDDAPGVSSPPKHLQEENKTLIKENAAETESDKILTVEKLVSDNKASEDHKVSVADADAVIDISTKNSNSDVERSKSSHEEQDQPCSLKDTQEDQNMLVEETLEVDIEDDDVALTDKNEDDDLALADAPSVEGALLKARAHEEVLSRDNDPPQEEHRNSSYTVEEAPRIALLDSSTAENEHKEDCLGLDHEEKKPMIHELDNDDTNNTSFVDQCQPSDQEINQLLIRCSSDPTDTIKSELEENRDHLLDDTEPADQNMLEKAVHCESEPSPTKNDHEIVSETTEKCVLELQSSTEINTHGVSSKTAVSETPPDPPGAKFSSRDQIGLRKSPSFDFGISFDARSEESDQTPLLYQDKTARRSLSICSNVRFQNNGLQKEYVGKALQFEAVQVEEKTIRMERSSSVASQALNKQQKNTNVITKETHTNSSNASPLRDDDEATISPKGNSKRKSRSSLFTTCICCTAAIS